LRRLPLRCITELDRRHGGEGGAGGPGNLLRIDCDRRRITRPLRDRTRPLVTCRLTGGFFTSSDGLREGSALLSFAGGGGGPGDRKRPRPTRGRLLPILTPLFRLGEMLSRPRALALGLSATVPCPSRPSRGASRLKERLLFCFSSRSSCCCWIKACCFCLCEASARTFARSPTWIGFTLLLQGKKTSSMS